MDKVVKGYKFPRERRPKIDKPKKRRWDRKMIGTVCPACNGKGEILMTGDAHKSSGIIPCPRAYFDGVGYPICVKGKLQFSENDLKNWDKLKKVYK